MMLQEKAELLDMLQEGSGHATVGCHYSVNESMVRSIKNKESISKILSEGILGVASI